MLLTEETFRALARSSPWRWRTLHFTYDGDHGHLEAWVRRPGELLVRMEGRKDFWVDDRDRLARGSSSVLVAFSPGRSDGVVGACPPLRWPHEVQPTWRDDGLVEARPSDVLVEYGDPMYQSYDWVAMLDPVELSHHTSVSGLREEARSGRRTWWARLRPEEGYDPTCGCCPLLWSFISDRDENADEHERDTWRPPTGTVYPEAYDVALDCQTGVVVEVSAVGRSSVPAGHRLELLDVDAGHEGLFRPRRRFGRLR